MGGLFTSQKDFAKAEAFADSALLYATVFNPQMMVGAYENIYKTARLNQHPAKSLDAFEKMVSLRDSLFGIEFARWQHPASLDLK